MKALITLFVCVFTCLYVGADQTQSGFRYGDRPKHSIFDPNGIITPKQQNMLAEPLAKVLSEEGLDVMVVILPDIGDTPPEHVAIGFANKWALTKINAVVLHVSGKEGSPWIFPGHVMGALLSPEKLKLSIDIAQQRAAAEPTDFGKVRAAATEASDILRFEMGGAVILSELLIAERNKQLQAFDKRRRLMKMAVILGLASLLPLCAGLVFLVIKLKSSSPKFFPNVRIIPRLGAPYSGGNHAVSKSSKLHP
jgi:hypothetical protein